MVTCKGKVVPVL